MATAIFSCHSSNPLDLGSDPRARNFVRKLEHDGEIEESSDDPLDQFAYEKHVSQVTQNYRAAHDMSMSSDDELALADTTMQEPPRIGDDVDAVGEEDIAMYEDEETQEVNEEGGEDEDHQSNYTDLIHGTDEETTILSKPPAERADIVAEIEDLTRNVPALAEDYELLDRLGTGTFSSVYKALDKHYHSKWDNRAWHGHHPPASSAHYQSVRREGRVYVAIKRIYVTSGPERIRNEIAIMEECRGCRHVSQLITAFRHQDQVVAIMPYHRNEDFRDFFRYLPMPGVKRYFQCLLRALRDIHSRNVIHRDVKPANFLFDPRTGTGTLCDFGLACKMEGPTSTFGRCFHSKATPEYPHGRMLTRSTMNMDIESYKRMQRQAREKSAAPSETVGYPAHDTRPVSKANRAGTRGFRAPEVLLKCTDQTGAIDVWSVGTILLFFLTGKFPIFQSSDDTEALMEIAAVIGKQKMEKVAALHSRTFATNVPSITTEGMSWARFVELNNPDYRVPRPPDRRYYPYYKSPLEYYRQERENSHQPPSSSSSPPPRSSSHPASDDNVDDDDIRADAPDSEMPDIEKTSHDEDIDNALDLLEQLLKPLSTERITPAQALDHPFLRDPDEPSDSEFAPHRYGEGVCADLHRRDSVTGDRIAYVWVPDPRGPEEGPGGERGFREARCLAAGEGIAIGEFPCELHAVDFGFVDRE
ncbi:kinase-like protein [Schizophyllum commune]